MDPTRSTAGTAGWLLAGWLLAMWLPAPAAHAQDKRTDVVASGQRGGSYHTYGTRLVNMLPSFRLRNQSTGGSLENLEMLAVGRATLGFAQADAYSLALRRSPDRYAGLTVVGRLNRECVFIAYRVKGPVLDLAGLGRSIDGRAPRIAVGEPGSGMGPTWGLLSTLDSALAEAEVIQRGGALALNQLSLGLLDAVGWVSDPRDLEHVMLRAMRAQPELDLMTLGGKFAHALENGTVVYEAGTVVWRADPAAEENAGKASATESSVPPLQTLCTVAGVFARKDANPRLVEAVSQALTFQREALLRRE